MRKTNTLENGSDAIKTCACGTSAKSVNSSLEYKDYRFEIIRKSRKWDGPVNSMFPSFTSDDYGLFLATARLINAGI